MAISVVGTCEAIQADGSTNVTLTLPAGMQQDDVVYVFTGDARVHALSTSSTGWTDLGQEYGATYISLAAFRKVMGASPDTTFVLDADLAIPLGAIGIALRGVHATPEDATMVQSNSAAAAPDNGSITTANDGALVIAVAAGGGAGDTSDASVTAPTGYSNQVDANADLSTWALTLAFATKSVAVAGAENPAAWGTWTAPINACMLTLAVRPAAGGAPSGSAQNMLLLGVG
jgi:hypothetical protein